MHTDFLAQPKHPTAVRRQLLARPWYSYLNNYVVLVCAAFFIIYARALLFVYVEGDDATSIIFHALGRRASLQPPYSPYHGMMDLLLSAFPPREPLLRVTAMTITSIATAVFFILALTVVCKWIGQMSAGQKTAAALVVLISCPEMFYLGLVFEPTMVALCLVAAAHLLALHAYRQMRTPSASRLLYSVSIIASLLLFAVGTACRWDIGLYGGVIVADLLTAPTPEFIISTSERRPRAFGFIWGALAIVAAVAAVVVVSGYDIHAFQGVLKLAGKEISNPGSWSQRLGAFQTLFTPAAVLLSIAGFLVLVRRRNRLAIVSIVGMVLVLPFLFSREPKMIGTALPGVFLLMVVGFHSIWHNPASIHWRRFSRVGLCALMVGPWLFGVKVNSFDTAWGPGFEIRTITAAGRDGTTASKAGFASAQSFSITMVDGGFALPTPEGPRPLGGHSAVLLGGRWPALIGQLDAERAEVIRQAISRRVPVVQDERNSYIFAHLLEMGFTTTDSRDRLLPNGFVERRFFNDTGESVTVLLFAVRSSLFSINQLDKLASMINGDTVILYSGYSSTVTRLVHGAPEAVQVLGPFSVILNTREFRSSLANERPR